MTRERWRWRTFLLGEYFSTHFWNKFCFTIEGCFRLIALRSRLQVLWRLKILSDGKRDKVEVLGPGKLLHLHHRVAPWLLRSRKLPRQPVLLSRIRVQIYFYLQAHEPLWRAAVWFSRFCLHLHVLVIFHHVLWALQNWNDECSHGSIYCNKTHYLVCSPVLVLIFQYCVIGFPLLQDGAELFRAVCRVSLAVGRWNDRLVQTGPQNRLHLSAYCYPELPLNSIKVAPPNRQRDWRGNNGFRSSRSFWTSKKFLIICYSLTVWSLLGWKISVIHLVTAAHKNDDWKRRKK